MIPLLLSLILLLGLGFALIRTMALSLPYDQWVQELRQKHH